MEMFSEIERSTAETETHVHGNFLYRHLAVDCKTGEIVFETHFSK